MADAETRPFWDSQFDVRNTIPDFAAWQDRQEALSAEADRHGVPERIPVGNGPASLLTLRVGRRTRSVVFVNGVDWQTHHSSTFSFVAETAVAANATLAIVEYRSLPQVRMADAVEDVASAVDAAIVSCQQTVVVGYGGGAHLAVEAAIRAARQPIATIAISGVYDLDPLRGAEIGRKIELNREEAARFSPLQRADAVRNPVHLFVGADETVEYRRQSVRMFEALRDAGKVATFTVVPRRHQASIVTDLADPSTDLSRLVQRLLE